MPVVVHPDPPPPMSVEIATRVFGSTVLVGLVRHYRTHRGATQKEAAESLQLPQQLVSTNTRLLIDAGVVVIDVPARGPYAARHSVDEQRVGELLQALRSYSLG